MGHICGAIWFLPVSEDVRTWYDWLPSLHCQIWQMSQDLYPTVWHKKHWCCPICRVYCTIIPFWQEQKDRNSPEFEYVCERIFEVRYKREVMLAAQWILSAALRSRCSQGTQGHVTAPGGQSVLGDKRSEFTTLRAWQELLHSKLSQTYTPTYFDVELSTNKSLVATHLY